MNVVDVGSRVKRWSGRSVLPDEMVGAGGDDDGWMVRRRGGRYTVGSILWNGRRTQPNHVQPKFNQTYRVRWSLIFSLLNT